MTEPTTVLTVRGEAHVVIPPDEAEICCVVRSVPTDRFRSVTDVRAKLAKVTSLLHKWGAVPRTPETLRGDLTSLVCGLVVQEDRDDRTGQQTGRYRATTTIRVFARTFGGIETLITALSALDGVEIVSVRWSVDRDHPGWARARTEAARAAIRSAHDYARVLGGALLSVEQLADAGLMDQFEPQERVMAARSAVAEAGFSLDPEPQQLSAVVEARFTATVSLAALSAART
jgi:uncharacterized protein YggE